MACGCNKNKNKDLKNGRGYKNQSRCIGLDLFDLLLHSVVFIDLSAYDSILAIVQLSIGINDVFL